jgi:hypothetical protein
MKQTAKQKSMSRFFLFLLLLGILGVPFSLRAGESYSPEVLANLVKPSVVRIITHTIGEAEITPIKVDVKRGLIAVDEESERKKVKVDEYVSGSGFIIHPDGYIATNAHVVSQETIKHLLASDSALAAFYENALYLSDEEAQSFLQSGEAEAFGKRILETVIENSRFDFTSDTFVLNPQSEKEKASDLVKEAFPATVESLNESFLEDDRDVALIKIGLDRLPALPLSTENALSVGSTTYIFGFPGTAELNMKSPLEATFTRGVVSAFKTAAGKDFPIYQTDAKVSQGSSGGPLFNDQGEVAGLVTFQTGELDRSSGDNFAFALPVSLILDEAGKIGLVLDRHELFSAFAHGIKAFQSKRCQDAFRYFRITEAANEVFSLERSVAPYQERCRSLEANGLALDTRWDMFRDSAREVGTPILSLVGGAVFFVAIFGAALFWLVRQVRREEEEIGVLRRIVRDDERRFLERRYGSERIAVHLKNVPVVKKSFQRNREQ